MPKMKRGRSAAKAAATAAAPEVAVPAAAIGAGFGAGATTTGNIIQAPIDTVTSHSHEGVLLWSLLLLGLSTWSGFGKPTFDVLVGNTSTWKTQYPFQLIIGGVVFCVVLAMIANSSNEAETMIVFLLVAMWILFIMFNGLTTIESVFAWFKSGAGLNIVGGQASGNFGPLPQSVINAINTYQPQTPTPVARIPGTVIPQGYGLNSGYIPPVFYTPSPTRTGGPQHA